MSPADWPAWWANTAAMALFVLAGMLVFLVPRDELLKDAPDKRTWRDIRWWGVALAVTQIGIYLIFT